MNEHRSTELNDLFSALSKAQEDMNVALKDASNPFFKSKYANLQMVIEASRPALCKNNLAVTQQLIADDKITYLITTLGHSSGQWISSKAIINPLKPDIQSLGSYITYMRRYSYSAIVGVYDGDEDDDGNAASKEPEKKWAPNKIERPVSEEQLQKIVDIIGVNLSVFNDILTRYNIKELKDLKEYQALEIIRSK